MDDQLAKIEKMLADGMSEEQILANFGLRMPAPQEKPYDKLKSDLSSAATGAKKEVGDIYSGMRQQVQGLEDSSWMGKIGQALRTGTYGPLVDTIKGIAGLGGGMVSNGIEAVKGNPEAGGRGVVDGLLLLAGARGMGKVGVPAEIPAGLPQSLMRTLRPGKMLGPEPPMLGPEMAPPGYVPPRTPSAAPPIERFPSPMREWLAESTAGTPSPGMMGVNPEFPFLPGEFGATPKPSAPKLKFR